MLPLDISLRWPTCTSYIVQPTSRVQTAYILGTLPLALSAVAYMYILLRFTFTPNHEGETRAGAIDVAACFHINEFVSTS